jgi:aminopeptidase N
MQETRKEPHKAIYLKDYRPPDYRIETTNLAFELDETRTVVRSTLTVSCNHDRCDGIRPLVLYGRDLVLKSVKLDGQALH